jgi:hypothetical protein
VTPDQIIAAVRQDHMTVWEWEWDAPAGCSCGDETSYDSHVAHMMREAIIAAQAERGYQR